MPIYEYKCESCGYNFEIKQAYGDNPITICPECKDENIHKVFHAPYLSISKEPQTLGHLAAKNTEKMGKYELESARKKHGKKEKHKPWYNPEGKDLTKELGSLTPKEKANYIKKGKK